jgi:hypothetical protein
MTSSDAWVCRVCWKLNRPRDENCWKCKTVRDVDEAQAEVRRRAIAARAAEPGPVPDIVVALPVVIFRSYGRVWIRGGIGLFGLLALIVFGGVTDVVWLVLTGGFAAWSCVASSPARFPRACETARSGHSWWASSFR